MASTGFSSQVGQAQFLQLLVAQMKSQNPMEPTSNQEFLGQLAQFSTLSGIETLNANFSDMMAMQDLTQGSSLIGKQISYMNSSNTTATGVVQSVGVTNGKLELQVGSDSVTVDKVLKVTAAA